MQSLVLLSLPIEMGKSKSPLIKRKGNCPLCRINIRQIFYKNRVISPKYLLEFDQIYAES